MEYPIREVTSTRVFGSPPRAVTWRLSRADQTVESVFGSAQTPYSRQRTDVSYGIDPSESGLDAIRFFPTPTPGFPNGAGVEGFVSDTSFSVDRGYFSTSFSVDVTTSTPGATLVYTTDGSLPSLTNGTQVNAAEGVTPIATIPIATTTSLRAAAYKNGFLPTNVDTQTYLFLSDVIAQPEEPAGFPTQWGTAPAVDYGMDPEIVGDAAYVQALMDGLRDLPALTIATDVEGLFGTGGIYSNPTDDQLEVPISAEYILPDGRSGFQIDAGLKIAGGASRQPNNSPKHSMSLRFRETYGASKLNYDLFAPSPVDSFNSLQLRALYNNSWIHWNNDQRSRGTLIRDQFLRDSLLAAGQDDAGRGSYVHLYLNGLYWGVYNLHERHDSSHYAEYQGGDSDDYDALNGGAAIDGDRNSYDQMLAVVATGDWNAIQQVLDVDNFIDWTLAQAFGGNADLKVNGNWRAAGGGSADGLWRMYAWDSERILEGITANPPSTITDATGMLSELVQVPEFVVRFGDRIQTHFFDGGAFAPEPASTRWSNRVTELSDAIVAESARWGDYRRDVDPRGETPSLYERDIHWNNENDRLTSTYFPARSSFVVDQYIGMGLMPSVPAPQQWVDGEFRSSGQVTPGSSLRFVSEAETVYYTVDGTDPRVEGGGVHPGAIAYDPSTIDRTVLSAGSVWKYHDLGVDLGQAWRQPAYDDSAWASGNAQFGFGDGDEATVVSFGGDAGNKHRTTYFRTMVHVPEGDYTSAKIRLRRDDGAVVYLNGQELLRSNLPGGEIRYSTSAPMAAPDDGEIWQEFVIPASLVASGSNSLAVEIHQNSPTSSDLSFDLEWVVSQQTATPLTLDDSTLLRSRARDDGGNWSALREALFVVPHEAASAVNLRVTEVHYHPRVDGDAEFIELQNITSGDDAVTVDLDFVTLVDGPSSPLVLPAGTSIAAGEYALLVADTAAFLAAYPQVDPAKIVGQYTGKLSNSGETIRLLDASGDEILDLRYRDSDPWPLMADGFGASLVMQEPVTAPANEWGKPYRWRGSVELGGSPGNVSLPIPEVSINEVLAQHRCACLGHDRASQLRTH